MSTLDRPVVPRRVAMVSVHTSPLEQPGTGDAGGMNVYILEVAKQLGARGIGVDVFTRTTSSLQPAVVEVAPGVETTKDALPPCEDLFLVDPAEGLGVNDPQRRVEGV